MKPLLGSVLVALLSLGPSGPAAAQTLHTNEGDIAEFVARVTLDVADPMAVFAFILDRLPDRVNVRPTENYYYFRFTHNGAPYVGNLRLAAKDRDEGVLHFAYGDQPNDWRAAIETRRLTLHAKEGVTVEKVENLVYRVTHKERSVTFALNDLSGVKPPDGLMTADETYIGPVFDESAFRFFLVFNTAHKVFHYLLDMTQPVPDQFVPLQDNPKIIVGKRTGFAFYRDGERAILIGVNERNSQLNTPYDGPFDQLPENFVEGETLREAILAVEPDLKGKIDRTGNIEGRNERFLIHPFLLYRRLTDLNVFHRCLTHPRVPEAIHPRCFVIPDSESQKASPLPMGLIRRR